MAADRQPPGALDDELAVLHARAVLAIARGGGGLEPEECARLVARIEARSGRPVALDELLLLEPLEPAELAALSRAPASPFRQAGVHPSELAEMIVADGISVVLGKGHVSEEEGRVLLRFAVALGCSVDDVRRMSVYLHPFLAALEEAIELGPGPGGAGAGAGGAARARPARGPGSSSRRRRRGTAR